MINFKSIPFLKILLPYIIGICSVIWIGIFQNLHQVVFITLLAWSITFVIQKRTKLTGRLLKIIFSLLTYCLLFLLAFESCFFYQHKYNVNHYSRYIVSDAQFFKATIQDIPVVSNKAIKLPVQIQSIESNHQWHYAEGNTIIYLKNDSAVKLMPGQTVFVKAKFSYVHGPKNPYEFDYKEFLENRNIFHVVYATSKSVYATSSQNTYFSVSGLGLKIKSRLVEFLRNNGLSQEAFSICSALLVGYDDEVDDQIMQSFSHSGTLHILSVSGMHTGVLYSFVLFLFSLFDKTEQYKKTRFVIVLLCLLLFVFVTGFYPSVLRAALMLSLVLFGKTFYHQGNSFNTLLVSAFLLLLFNPYLILDVGFLLSYLAVFGIMYLYPILHNNCFFENVIIQWIWRSVMISISATLFTLPISLYYFHQFPLWFIVSNLMIIPISVLLMFMCGALVLLYKVVIVKQLLVVGMNGLVSLMLWFTKFTDSSSYGFIDNIPFSMIDLVWMFLAIIAFLFIITYKNYSSVVTFCVVVIVWFVSSIYFSYQDSTKKELVVFHINQKSIVLLRLGNKVYFHLNGINQTEYQRIIKPYLLTISNLKVTSTIANTFKYKSLTAICANRQELLIPPENSNYIIVSHNTPVRLTTNSKTKPLIIADCSNSYKFVKKLKQQCALMEVPFYSVKEKGALRIIL